MRAWLVSIAGGVVGLGVFGLIMWLVYANPMFLVYGALGLIALACVTLFAAAALALWG